MLTVPREHRDDGNELRQIDSDLGLWGELQTLDAEANQVRWQDLDRSADRSVNGHLKLPVGGHENCPLVANKNCPVADTNLPVRVCPPPVGEAAVSSRV